MTLRGGRRSRGIGKDDPRTVGLGEGAGISVTPSPASLILSCNNPTVTQTGSLNITPTAAALVLSCNDPGVLIDGPIAVTPAAASLKLSCNDPIVYATGASKGALIPALHANP